MTRRIFFLHNPKAGGSSLREVLRTISGGTIAPVFDNGPNIHQVERSGYGKFANYDYYAGHYGFDEYQRLALRHLLVTNFRDPVARVYSIYRYWRHNISLEGLVGSHPDDIAIVALAHTLSFSEFIRARETQLYISNFHFRQLYSSGWEWSTINWRAKWTVKRRIARMPWFYIAETQQASAQLMERCFRIPIQIPRENQSLGTPDPISPDDIEHLTRLNTLDYDIYAFALGLQETRLRSAA